MTAFTVQETQTWWKETIKDKNRLIKFLQKLYRTELSGYTDHLRFMANHGIVDGKTATILSNIALDELKHAHLIKQLLEDRHAFKPSGAPSLYWLEVNRHVKTLEDYCAVNHFGEGLAAFRFKIIRDMAETPNDIKAAIEIILPDEQFHEVTLKKLAGDQALERMRHAHEQALEAIKDIDTFIPSIEHDSIKIYTHGKLLCEVDTDAEAEAIIGTLPLGADYECRSAKTGDLIEEYIHW